MTRTGVRASFCAAHRNNSGQIHGHSYIVWAWFAGGDALSLQAHLCELLTSLDHSELALSLTTGEQIAAWVGTTLKAQRVLIERPVEGLAAEWRHD